MASFMPSATRPKAEGPRHPQRQLEEPPKAGAMDGTFLAGIGPVEECIRREVSPARGMRFGKTRRSREIPLPTLNRYPTFAVLSGIPWLLTPKRTRARHDRRIQMFPPLPNSANRCCPAFPPRTEALRSAMPLDPAT